MCLSALPAVLDPWFEEAPARGGGFSAALLAVRPRLVYNSAYPDDRNNGALWAGRGIGAAVSAGVELSVGPLSAALYPTFAYQGNSAVDLPVTTRPGFDSLTYAWRRIDWVQRYGTEPYTTIDPGQSVVRVDMAGFAVGASTENLWWGPGQRNSIIMSSSAPGFPHVFVGTSRPAMTPIGRVNAEFVWGRLAESEYFDTLSDNNERLFAGMTLTYEPRGLTGLQLGFNRAFTHVPDSVSNSQFIFGLFDPVLKEGLRTPENPEGQSPDDQIGSIFARWVLQPAQFEVYVEWSKADYNVNWWDFLHEPDAAQGYTMGFQKIVTRKTDWLRLTGELTHLNASTTFRTRGSGTPISYYTHARVIQGYTHNGQLLGAWIGPNSNSQYLGVDWIGRKFAAGGYLERVSRDVDIYHTRFADTHRRHGHDTELMYGVRGSLTRGPAALTWRAGSSIRSSRNFLRLSGVTGGEAFDYLREKNFSFELSGLIHVNSLLRKPAGT